MEFPIKSVVFAFLINQVSTSAHRVPSEELETEHWNVTQWWLENKETNSQTEYSAPIREIIHWHSRGPQSPDYHSTETGETLDSEESGVKSRKTLKPKTSIQQLQATFSNYFMNIRSVHSDKNKYYQIQDDLKKKFLEFGLETASQQFWPPEIRYIFFGNKPMNIIGVLPGPKRKVANEDEILIVGAHYDTVPQSPGVDDNGSGATAVMEVARLLTSNKCRLNKTIMFVLFDMEEDGLKGSKHFVKDFLMPVEVEKNRAKIVGAIILDMILEHDPRVNTQSLGPFAHSLPEWTRFNKQNRFRADFAAVWARRGVDTELYRRLQKNWLNQDKFKLVLMSAPLPKYGRDINRNSDSLRQFGTFFRSDHASFWYPPKKSQSFEAILITDLGPWRRNTANHYHRKSDDQRFLTDNNLGFLKNTIDSVTATIIDTSNGKCSKP